MALAGTALVEENTPLFFPSWKETLAGTQRSPDERAHYERQIIRFLHYCHTWHAAATVALAREYLESDPARAMVAREPLRWLFRARGGHVDRPARSLVPPAAATDLGGADWERDLIAALRRRGFLWRTEQAYRAWARRFAEHLRPRSPYAAEGDDVAVFLSKLAVEKRVSVSTQKQALNALVFFLQEGLRRSVGELHFKLARRARRMPTVLSRTECRQVFEHLPGTMRLMAELMYGAGLR